MKLAELSWPEVEKLNRDIVVIYPIAALEQHSRHLPFFTDSILCESIVTRLEAALPKKILLLPVQWLGASAHHLGMAGTVSAEAETYLKIICEPLRCLLREKFQRVLIINGHGGNIDGFHLALRQLAIDFPNALLAGASYWDLAEKEIPALLEGNRKSVGHACEFETSLMLHFRPALVRKNEIADDHVKRPRGALSELFVPLDMKRQTNHGGNGQPTLATAKKGKALLEIIIAKGIATVKELSQTDLPQ